MMGDMSGMMKQMSERMGTGNEKDAVEPVGGEERRSVMKNRLTLWFLAQQQPLRVRSCSERAEDGRSAKPFGDLSFHNYVENFFAVLNSLIDKLGVVLV